MLKNCPPALFAAVLAGELTGVRTSVLGSVRNAAGTTSVSPAKEIKAPSLKAPIV